MNNPHLVGLKPEKKKIDFILRKFIRKDPNCFKKKPSPEGGTCY
jgi:hypothetical protein